MKKLTLTLLALVMSTSLLMAQTDTILRHLPTQDQLTYLKAMHQLSTLDESELESLASRLKPYGSQTNTSIQFALDGYAGYVMKPGREQLRKEAVQAYGQALKVEKDPMNQQFLIRKLQLMGKDDAIPFIAPKLTDTFLVHAASQALATIGSKKAKRVLREAVTKASKRTLPAILQALGFAEDTQANAIISSYAQSKNFKVRKAALYALASIGNPSSATILLKAAKRENFAYHPANATGDALLYIRRLINNNHKKAAHHFISKMLQNLSAKDHNAFKTALKQYQGQLTAAHPTPPNTLTPKEKNAGFQLLFNGKDLAGWVGNKEGYKVEKGAIMVHPGHGSGGNLYTTKEYDNFIFRFQFKLTPGANNGIGIRAPLKGNAAYQGMEIQVIDNTAPQYKNLHLYQYHGSVYGVIPAKRGYQKPVGEWNNEEIKINGTKIKVTLNGHVIVNDDLATYIQNGTMDGRDHPGLDNKTGHIGFLGHGDVVYYRNIRIKSI